MTEEQIRLLLRQRSADSMPAGYAESLVKRLHQRQRSEMLRGPLWRMILERAGTFWGEHSTGTGTYALSLAAMLAVGIGVIFFFKPQAPVAFGISGHGQLAVSREPVKAHGTPPQTQVQEPPQSSESPVEPVQTQQVSFGR